MKLERFAYFLAVAQTGSITLGAQKSFITQTAMSQQMAALEAELGLTLLKRSKSGTSLTEAGQALVPMAEQLVQCYQAIETFADAQRRQPRTLTIAYTGPMEQQLLLRAIPAFRAHHPEVELRVRQLSMARIGTALEAGDCDIALAIPGEIPLQQMKHVTVMERPICAAVASSHPLAGKDSVTLPELTPYPVILLQAGANRRASSQIARWLMGLGWTKDALRFADTIEDQLLMINLNQGISFMPQGSYPVGIRLIPIVSDAPILHHTEAVMRQMTPLHLQFVEQLRQADLAERHPTQAGHRQNGDALRFLLFKTGSVPFSPHPPMVPAVLANRDAPCHHLVAPGRRALSLPLCLLRPNHRQKQQLERPYPPADQQPPRQAVARSPTFANQLHPHVTAAAARTFHAKHTLSFVDLHPLYRMYAAFAIAFPAFRTARVERVEVAALPRHRDG